jgi:hypothetical protein
VELSTEKNKLEEVAVYVLAEYCGGLRGEEGLLISLAGMLKYWEATRTHANSHIMMTLHGRFKGETGERWHLLPVADETRTHLPVQKWFGRLSRRRSDWRLVVPAKDG